MLRDHRIALGSGAGQPIVGLTPALYDSRLLFGSVEVHLGSHRWAALLQIARRTPQVISLTLHRPPTNREGRVVSESFP